MKVEAKLPRGIKETKIGEKTRKERRWKEITSTYNIYLKKKL